MHLQFGVFFRFKMEQKSSKGSCTVLATQRQQRPWCVSSDDQSFVYINVFWKNIRKFPSKTPFPPNNFFLTVCYILDLKCSPKVKGLVPRWWPWEVGGTRERSLGHWRHGLEGDGGTLAPSSFFAPQLWYKHYAPPCAPTIICCPATGLTRQGQLSMDWNL